VGFLEPSRPVGLKVRPLAAENPNGMRGRNARIWLVCGALLCALLPLATTAAPAAAIGSPSTAAANQRPNILLLVSDDQAWSTFSRRLMPSVYGQLADNGVLFKRAYVNTSLCCPSRAQILTGLYEHDTGVDENEVSLTRPTLPMALQDAGYRTMLAGKYLNSWPCEPRPEFDRWVCTSTPDPSTTALTDPWINVDGKWSQYQGYQPDILGSMVTDFIDQTPDDQPFFAMYTPTSPHLPADDPRYDDMKVSPPRGKAFNANTMNAGTPRFARRSALTPDEVATADENYTSMAHAVRSLDDAMGNILDSLGDRSRDTLVVFLSDNGFLYGEHRRFGKNDQWEESVNVPMIVRYPAMLPEDKAFVSNALVQNVDIAPTIADLVGLTWAADGRSFLPILQHKKPLRTAALIEQCRGVSRGALDCTGLNYDGGRVQTPGFDGIVTQRYKYTEFDDGSVQLVDLKHDPHEMHDLSRDPGHATLRRSLQQRLHAMLRPRLQTTIVSGPGPSIAARVAGFTFFSPSRFASYRCRLTTDGVAAAWHPCPGSFDAFGDLADGHYRFEVAGISEGGHVDPTPASRSFTIEPLEGPSASILTATQSGPDVSFTYTSTVPSYQADWECRLVPWGTQVAWSSCDGSGAAFFGLADGDYRFEARVHDLSTGTISQRAAGWFLRVDTVGPSMAFSTAPARSTKRDDATFRFEPLEATVGPITCTLDGKAAGCADGRINVSHVSWGAHELVVKAKDLSGNVGLTRYPWIVDRTGPEAMIVQGPDQLSNSRTATFDLWSSDDPGLFVCRLDHHPTMPCFTAPVLAGVRDGHHTLTVWAYDMAMNASAPQTYSWDIDATAPRLVLVDGPRHGAVTTSHTATFKVSSNEPASLSCSLDGAAFTSCSSPVHYLSLASGEHTFEVYAQDRAGNQSGVLTRTWTIS
jgi:arylsulfatase A-like enzyme